MEKAKFTDQIITKILMHLPVKSLLRFRSICKSWRSLIDDPTFIDLHNTQMVTSSRDMKLFQIVYQLYPNEGLRSWCYSGHPCHELTHPGFPVSNTKPCTYIAVGSCNGFICFLTNFLDGTKDINLWNPSLRKCRTLRDSTYSIERERRSPSFGFGFDGKSDHKLIKITYVDDRLHSEKKQWSEVEMYSLNEHTWTSIGDVFPSQYYYARGDTMTINGCLHWLTEREFGKLRPRRLPILSFNVVNQKFVEFWLPNAQERETNCISTLDGSLSVCAKLNSSDIENCLEIEVWLMKEYGVEESWTKLYVTRLDEELSGPIIPLRVVEGGDHEVVVYINKNVFLYDPETEEFVDFGIWASGIGVPYVTSFVESLVWVEPVVMVESSTTQNEKLQEIEFNSMEVASNVEAKEVDAGQGKNCNIL